jgi:para-aminobenzoate synthetase component 1
MTDGFVIPVKDIDTDLILFDMNGISNLKINHTKKIREYHSNHEIFTSKSESLWRNGLGFSGFKIEYFRKYPITFELYKNAFDNIIKNIRYGNSYLTNLTFQSKIELNLNLFQIFSSAKAKYKLYLKDKFVCCSPECFVKIIDGEIYSYPMKGTIDSSIPDALSLILNNEKEKAEHYTIVDLIRNDLSIVSKNVQVTKFRYADFISTNQKNLLQISSEIKGTLTENYQTQLGDIFRQLLPAGSVTGAPKKKTVEIIKETESYDRGFYTGIFGIFDGQNLDSAVAIRIIEQSDYGLYYKSGGGITYLSDAESEYQELIDKIYVPID